MGKLRILRRAIERDPRKWFSLPWGVRPKVCPACGEEYIPSWQKVRAYAPKVTSGGDLIPEPYEIHGRHYKDFVLKVLRGLGYDAY